MTVLLYPGAGSDASHSSLLAIERWIAPHPCVRDDFPYRKEGRKAPDRAPKLLASIRERLESISADEPLVLVAAQYESSRLRADQHQARGHLAERTELRRVALGLRLGFRLGF